MYVRVIVMHAVGGLLNATCGNATELIIALLALYRGKMDVVKYTLLGSVLSNLLLVLGSSLLFGGIANLNKEQRYDRVIMHFRQPYISLPGQSIDQLNRFFFSFSRLLQKQADVNSLLLLLGLLCLMLPLMFRYSTGEGPGPRGGAHVLELSRASSIVMLIAYVAYIIFQMKTHRQLFEGPQVNLQMICIILIQIFGKNGGCPSIQFTKM